jgi:hypothetical protein
VLAAIIQNLQSAQPAETTRLPTVKIDRGGGGPSWPSYDVVDIMAAAAAFPEISGEDPLSRAVRRTRWIGEALPKIREARQKKEAAAFLAGAYLADRAAEERHAAAGSAAAAPALAELARVAPPRLDRGARRERGQFDGGGGAVVAALILGAAGALALAARGRRRRH